MTTTAKTNKFELIRFDKQGKMIGTTEFNTLDEMIEAMTTEREENLKTYEDEIKSAVNGLLQYINHFGYEFNVKYYSDFSCADLTFKDINYPLWTGAMLETIAEFMSKPVNDGFGWTIDHKGILCIYNRKN
jgi:hypothetical protein